MVRWLYRRRAMLDSFVMRAWRRWYRRWGYRLRVLGSFPTLWRQFCSNCGTRRWQAGNDEWYGLCMGCLDGYSRAALLEWGPGRGRMHESQGETPPAVARGGQKWWGWRGEFRRGRAEPPPTRPPNQHFPSADRQTAKRDQKAITSRSFRIETVPCKDPPIKKDGTKGQMVPLTRVPRWVVSRWHYSNPGDQCSASLPFHISSGAVAASGNWLIEEGCGEPRCCVGTDLLRCLSRLQRVRAT